MCARRRSPFLCLAKERNQRKATPSLRPLRCATGQTCVTRLAGCAAELTSRLRRSVQTTAASQSTKRVHAALHAPPRKPRAAGAATGGLKSIRAIAALGPQGAGAARRVFGAERSDGPCGFPLPSARAEEHRAWGGHGQRSMPMLRELTHCGCLNGAPQARSEFRNAAPGPSTAGCP